MFIGLSLYVAVTQGAPEIVFANPVDTMPAEELVRTDVAVFSGVPRALARPSPPPDAVIRHAAQRVRAPELARGDVAVERASWPRPALPAPSLFAAGPPRPAPEAPGRMSSVMQGNVMAAPRALPRDARPGDIGLPEARRLPGITAPQAPDGNGPALAAGLDPLQTVTRPESGPRLVPLRPGAWRPDATGPAARPDLPDPAMPQVAAAAPDASAKPAPDAPHRRPEPQAQATGIFGDPPPSRPAPLPGTRLLAALGGLLAAPVADASGPVPPEQALPERAARPARARPVLADRAADSPAIIPATINGDRVYVRPAPSLSATPLTQVNRDTAVLVFGQWGRWVRARVMAPDGPTDGWVWDSYVTPTPPPD
ncbi:hypothetical protein ATO11_00255 [Pseudaestuariivita atlantica]|uniref:SH3b domain-containing protein n=1 Tax=Pseudaestuariivita atlantica TaxID=1317121 RepID=A0A0L1JTM3_9RHOB|nr:hypothetical protein ATO11_00255 [Pseudaestuariivita atlantica]